MSYKLYNLAEALQKKYNKLYNLAEALSLDDIDYDSENIDAPIHQAKSEIVSYNRFEDFARQRILGTDDNPLTALEEILIKQVNNDPTGEYDGIVMVQSLEQLATVLRRGLKFFGFEGNYNWINTSRITKMVNLFNLAFGENASKFNGDISRWNVSNVDNMMYTFKGCASLTCDISNWDFSNVKYWSSATYAGTSDIFTKICNAISKDKRRMPKKTLRSL